VFPSLDLVLTPPAGGVRSAGGPREILAGQAVSRLHLVEPGGEAPVGLRDRGIRFLPVAGPVLAVTGAGPVQALASCHFFSENPRFTLAKDLGSGKTLPVVEPSGFLVENHSTPWSSGSSAASLAHSSAFSLPSMPWWLGHHRISILTLGSLARRVAICCLPSRAYSCPSPGSSEAILPIAAWRSVRMVTSPSLWFLAAATYRVLARAAHSASQASWPQPMWVLWLFQVWPFSRRRRIRLLRSLQTGPVRKDRQRWSVGPLGLARRCLSFLDGEERANSRERTQTSG